MSDIAKMVITMPRKKGDPTEFTYQWAENGVKLAKELGYNIIAVKEDDATYNNVTKILNENKVRLFVHMGHGCPSSLQGQHECIVVRKYSVDELICMAESPFIEERQRVLRLLNPLGELSCPGICSIGDVDPCSPLCLAETNINLLKGSIIFSVACHSLSQLGKCSIKYGVETYVGYNDLLMFPVDTIHSQDMFGDVQLTFLKELLMGKTVQEAEQTMSELEDTYIRRFKKIKYISLPMLWNKLHRKILGNSNNLIYNLG